MSRSLHLPSLVLLLASCAGTVQEKTTPSESPDRTITITPVDAHTGAPIGAAYVNWVSDDVAVVPFLVSDRATAPPFELELNSERLKAKSLRVGIESPDYITEVIESIDVHQSEIKVELERRCFVGANVRQGPEDGCRVTAIRIPGGEFGSGWRAEGSGRSYGLACRPGAYLVQASQLELRETGGTSEIVIGAVRSKFVIATPGVSAVADLDFTTKNVEGTEL